MRRMKFVEMKFLSVVEWRSHKFVHQKNMRSSKKILQHDEQISLCERNLDTCLHACVRACVNVCLLFLAAVGTGQAFTIWHSIYILKQEVLSAALWVRSNDPWLVRSFTTLYFNRSISIACAVKLRTHIRELNSICLLAKMCDNIGKWTELWFYAHHPHDVWPLFYALHRRTEKRKLNFYELDTRIGVKI